MHWFSLCDGAMVPAKKKDLDNWIKNNILCINDKFKSIWNHNMMDYHKEIEGKARKEDKMVFKRIPKSICEYSHDRLTNLI